MRFPRQSSVLGTRFERFHMAERGTVLKRKLDFWLGIPFLAAFGLLRFPFRKKAVPPFNEIAFLCFGAIGDLLLLSGVIHKVRAAFPDAHIYLICSKDNAAALPLIDHTITPAVFNITDIAGAIRFLRSKKIDVLFDSSQWARIGALISCLSGAKATIGFKTAGQFRHYAYDLTVTHSNDVHESDNFLSLILHILPNASYESFIRIKPLSRHKWPGGVDPKDCIAPHLWPSGISSHLKEWPHGHWIELAKSCMKAGHIVVLTGAAGDKEKTNQFLMRNFSTEEISSGKIVSLAGETDLETLAGFFQQIRAVVSVNTGIMHLAALAGAPTIAINGPTNPLRWGPLGSKTKSLLPAKGDCAYLNLGFEYPRGAKNILENLTMEQVKNSLRELGIWV